MVPSQTSPALRLIGKVALVTGASSGIGEAIALRLAKEGASVVVNYSKSQLKADHVVKQIREMGREAFSVRADVSDTEQVDHMISSVVENMRSIDILVNNAGVYIEKGPIETVTDEIWDRTIDVNLKGAFLCCRRAVQEMRKTGKGKIINISSIYATVSEPNTISYCASKAGLIGLTRALALELAPKGINVNAIAPGQIDTQQLGDPPKRFEVIRNYVSKTPVGRIGTGDDIAAIAAFLASDESDFATGSVFVVDGGWLLQ